MTEPMSAKRLAEIREREKAATPEPWDRYGNLDFAVFSEAYDEDVPDGVGDVTHGSPREADAEFIAHARQDVPALLAEVKRLRAELRLAFSPGMYLDIQTVLDKALGTNEADGAGAGIVADVALLADRMRQAKAERDHYRDRLAEQDHGATILALEETIAAADADRDRLKAERDEARDQRDLSRVHRDAFRQQRDRLAEQVKRVEALRDRWEAAVRDPSAYHGASVVHAAALAASHLPDLRRALDGEEASNG